jgi:hypothetical protein
MGAAKHLLHPRDQRTHRHTPSIEAATPSLTHNISAAASALRVAPDLIPLQVGQAGDYASQILLVA